MMKRQLCGWIKPLILGPIFAIARVSVLLVFTTPAWAAEKQVLSGHIPTVVSKLNLQPVGRLPSTNTLHLAIGLPLRNKEKLSALLQQLYDPASPNYRRYLTPEQFTEMFGPTEQDYQAVVAFAKTNGFTVTATHPNRTLLDVSASVADIEKTFHVRMLVYQHPTEARTFYAPDVEPSLDLAVPVLAINGLNNYALPRPLYRQRHGRQAFMKKFMTGSGPSGSGPSGNYWGQDFRNAYAPGALHTGIGQSVALFECDGYFTNDIATYVSQAGLPSVTLTNVLIDGFNGIATVGDGGNVEVALDIEMAISMAHGLSKIVVYEGPTVDSAAEDKDILNQIATDNLARQISSSWLIPASQQNDQIYQQFATQGQSFFQACGDEDAYYPGIFQYQDSAYAILVGGTTLTMTSTGVAWSAETVWNWGEGEGTGGGISTNVPIPVWQQGISMTANHGSTVLRNIPDVALTADGVYVVADNGSAYIDIGGTSCAAPLWAAFTALVNQQAAANGVSPVGFINPAVYTIGQSANYSNCFHDITTGNNESPDSPSNFVAVAGYDLCTGWGTPTGTNLIYALAGVDLHPSLLAAGALISGGNGNGVIDTNECDQISLLLQNIGATASNITATISTPTVGVTVTQPLSGYPTLGTGGTVTNTTPFQICTTNSAYVCGTPVTLILQINFTGGSNTLGYTLPNGPCPPVASFTATPTNGPTPVVVNFTDTSGGTITNRFWNFGDGATTNTLAVNVEHTYTAVGTDTVTLIASGPLGSSTNVQANLITVQLGPVDHFAWGAIAYTQYQDTPFPVTIIAQDAGNDTVTNFNGTVILSSAQLQLIGNGNFEVGTLAGWTETNWVGGSGSWYPAINGAATPISGLPTATNPTGGTYYAVTDQTGPGTSALSQTFTVPPGWSPVVLAFDMFVNDWSGEGPIVNSGGLSYLLYPNQYARVDILLAGAGAFDTGTTVLTNLYLGVDSGEIPNPYTHYSFDLTALVSTGGTFVLRFAEVDNQYYLNMGIDNVSLLGGTIAGISPTSSGNFVGGVWTGAVSVLQTASSLSLLAQDGNGHSGTSTVLKVTNGGLVVTPATGLTATGLLGGPFSPASQVYTLTNIGTGGLSWQATNATTWVTLSATSGSLAVGSHTTVTVSINANANALPVGGHSDTVVFTNLTAAIGSTTRAVSLTVNPAPTTFQTWQLQYFGCTNCPQAAPDADPLGKGMSNTNQFLVGFNPTNAAAYLHITSVTRPSGATTNVVVAYLGASGDTNWSGGPTSRTNVLEFTTGTITGTTTGNYANSSWTQVPGQTNVLGVGLSVNGGTGLGTATNMVDSGGATNKPSRYYRVRVLLP